MRTKPNAHAVREHWVYLLLTAESAYVGQTVNFRRRMREHVKRRDGDVTVGSGELLKECATEDVRVAVVGKCHSHHAALVLEANWLAAVQRNGYKTPGSSRWAKYPPYAYKEGSPLQWSVKDIMLLPSLQEVLMLKLQPQQLLATPHVKGPRPTANPAIERDTRKLVFAVPFAFGSGRPSSSR